MNLVDDILSHSNIVDYISKYVSLRRAGSNRTGNCPFHKEKTPSFVVSETKQIFKCFGCGKGGNIISFAMEYERLDFVDSLKLLAEWNNLDLSAYPKYTQDPAIKEQKQQAKTLNQSAMSFFQQQLYNNPQALSYLGNRQIDNQIIHHFQLGYSPDSYYELSNHLKKQGFTKEQILESGVCKVGPSGDMFDFFRKRIIFPIFDVAGNCIAFAGRVLDPNDSPKYINLSDTALYDKSKTLYGIHIVKQHIQEHQCIIVVEGYMDVIGLYRIGLPVGVATCGTALSVDHIKQIKRYSDTVYFLFDNDEAGFSATVRGLKIAYGMDIYPSVLRLQHPHKDVDDFANAHGTKEELLHHKQDGMLFVIQHLIGKHDINNPVEKKKILHTCFDLIRSISDLSVTQHYLGNLAEQLHLSDQIIFSQYKVRHKSNRTYQKEEDTTSHHTLDSHLLLLALCQDNQRKNYCDQEQLAAAINYYNNLLSYLGNQTNLSPEQLQAHLLWRDYELETLDQAKRMQFIITMIKKQADSILKQIIKTSNIDTETKTALLNERKKHNL